MILCYACMSYIDGCIIICRWHFSCTDLETMLAARLPLPQDPDAASGTDQSYIIEGLGLDANGLGGGFYVDEISFSSEMRQFDPMQVKFNVALSS